MTALAGAAAASSAALRAGVRKIRPNNTALFVCDIQERFRSSIYGFPGVILTANKMIKGARLLDIPVVVTEQNPKALGHTVQELDISDAKLVVSKTKFSMVVPEVKRKLADWNTRSVILCGIASNVCGLQTALDLLDDNIDVHVLADGVSSMNRFENDIALQRMRDAGAVVTTFESVIFQLIVDSEHERFRAVSALVKEFQEASKANVLTNRLWNS